MEGRRRLAGKGAVAGLSPRVVGAVRLVLGELCRGVREQHLVQVPAVPEGSRRVPQLGRGGLVEREQQDAVKGDKARLRTGREQSVNGLGRDPPLLRARPGEEVSDGGVPRDRVGDRRCEGETPKRPSEGRGLGFRDATKSEEQLAVVVEAPVEPTTAHFEPGGPRA
ncbi:MAG: hypothetical protein ACYCVV_17795 [Acidimicrobiales bacterium]